jgi:hypothetical protein
MFNFFIGIPVELVHYLIFFRLKDENDYQDMEPISDA